MTTSNPCSRPVAATATSWPPLQKSKPILSANPRAPRLTALRGSRMLDSIRVRLTLWYTLVLALVLVFLAASTYFLYGRSLAQRTDSSIVELSQAFATTFRAELSDAPG